MVEFAYLGEGAVVHDPHLSIFLRPEMIQIGDRARLGGLIKLEGGEGLTIGEYVHIASFAHINTGGGRVTIGDHAACGSGSKIISGMPDLDYLHVSAAEPEERRHNIRKHTIIGPYAVIFTNAVILPGVTVGEGAVVGAGSVVTRDVPAWEIWAGNPAKKIGERDICEDLHLLEFS